MFDWEALNKNNTSVCHGIAQVAPLNMLILFFSTSHPSGSQTG
jgi:hypothetical protein